MVDKLFFRTKTMPLAFYKPLALNILALALITLKVLGLNHLGLGNQVLDNNTGYAQVTSRIIMLSKQ